MVTINLFLLDILKKTHRRKMSSFMCEILLNVWNTSSTEQNIPSPNRVWATLLWSTSLCLYIFLPSGFLRWQRGEGCLFNLAEAEDSGPHVPAWGESIWADFRVQIFFSPVTINFLEHSVMHPSFLSSFIGIWSTDL